MGRGPGGIHGRNACTIDGSVINVWQKQYNNYKV